MRRRTEAKEKAQGIKDWIFFERKEPTIFGHIVGCNIEGCPIPKGAKLIDHSLFGDEAEAIKEAKLLEQNGYNLVKKPRKK